eukprot:3944402-Amphidinium_carterae.1
MCGEEAMRPAMHNPFGEAGQLSFLLNSSMSAILSLINLNSFNHASLMGELPKDRQCMHGWLVQVKCSGPCVASDYVNTNSHISTLSTTLLWFGEQMLEQTKGGCKASAIQRLPSIAEC